MTTGTQKSSVTSLVEDVRKADTKALITNGTEAFPEDSFVGTYWTAGSGDAAAIIEPQYKPGTLYALASQNNTLSQCIEAMEVNIDGTAHSIKLLEGEEEDDAERVILEGFFSEPYPGKSMIEIRRACRRDLETTGNAYLEVIRNAADEVVMLNWADAVDMRLIRLGDPVDADKTLVRGGQEVRVRIRTRERRYVQLVNGKKIYFKEFGASRDLDRLTGAWADQGVRLPIEKRASEIIHMIGNKEPKTPYGTPRWINQLPSVLGSRKAEEHNLEFFDGGGIPPVLVIVQGGTLGDDVKTDLKNHLSGRASKHRAAVVEAVSTSGSFDSAGTVQVRVERFGSERQQDSMFQNYDKTCEENVRTAFRLPPLFIGKSGDMNFATAYTSYMVAEAQVFFPERDEFDSLINTRIVRELGVTRYVFRSLPMTLVDVQNQLKALDIVRSDKLVKGEEIVKSLNEITGLSLEYDEDSEEEALEAEEAAAFGDPPQGHQIDPATGLPLPPPVDGQDPTQGSLEGTQPQVTAQTTGTGAKPPYKASKSEVVALAADWADAIEVGVSEARHKELRSKVAGLEIEDLTLFNEVMAARLMSNASIDLAGVGELCGCAEHLMQEE